MHISISDTGPLPAGIYPAIQCIQSPDIRIRIQSGISIPSKNIVSRKPINLRLSATVCLSAPRLPCYGIVGKSEILAFQQLEKFSLYRAEFPLQNNPVVLIVLLVFQIPSRFLEFFVVKNNLEFEMGFSITFFIYCSLFPTFRNEPKILTTDP